MKSHSLMAAGVLLFAGALIAECGSKPVPPPDFTPIVSVEELMENLVDPAAYVIFDSVVTTVTSQGIVETMPTSEEDWLKVERAALLIAEATNLLKMPRRIAADDVTPEVAPEAAPGAAPEPAAGPELTPPEILAKVDADRAAWNAYADRLRDVAVKGIAITKAKDVKGLYQLGSDLDRACENCHLNYWYPGKEGEQP